MAYKTRQRWPGGLHHGRIKPIEQAPRTGRECAELPGRASAGKALDRLGVSVFVIEQVKGAPIWPKVSGEALLPQERHVIIQSAAQIFEERIENAAHRQNRRPGINGAGRRWHRAHPPPGAGMALKHGHLQARVRKARGGGKTCDPRANYDGARPRRSGE
jgi:hypothetical protein